jgi:NADH:ubiquinone oxidoreductase subunit 2 (subunit N)
MGIFKCFNIDNNFAQLSINRAISGINVYLTNDFLVSFLILNLAGLPPMFIFFLKINIIISLIGAVDYLILIFVIFNSLINIFFYILFFRSLSYTDDMILVFFSRHNTRIKRVENSFFKYRIRLIINYINIVNFFGFFFFFDFYVIISFFVL